MPAPALTSEGGGIPHWIIDAKADEPAEQQVELDALDQLALRTDRVERLQQQRPQQTLRRDRFTSDRRTKRVELRGPAAQRGVYNLPDHSRREACTRPLLQINAAEQ
jgi:hypothetical protein